MTNKTSSAVSKVVKRTIMLVKVSLIFNCEAESQKQDLISICPSCGFISVTQLHMQRHLITPTSLETWSGCDVCGFCGDLVHDNQTVTLMHTFVRY